MLLGVGEIGRAGLHLDGISRPGQVSYLQLVAREMLVQIGLKVGEILGTVEEGISYEGDPGPLRDVQRQAGLDGGRSLRARSGLLVDGVLRQAWILGGGLFSCLAILAVGDSRFLFFRLPGGLFLRLRVRCSGEIQAGRAPEEDGQQAGDKDAQDGTVEFHGSGFRYWG